MIGAFGAVAAVVAAGIQFGDIGKLHDGDLRWAITGAVAAFGGVSVAMYAVARLLVPRTRSVAELAGIDAVDPSKDPATRDLSSNPQVLGPFDSLEELNEALIADRLLYRRALNDWRGDPCEANTQVLNIASTLEGPTREAEGRFLDWANYTTLKQSFDRRMNGVVLPALAVAAAGLTLFAIKVSEEQPKQEASDLQGAQLANAGLRGARLHAAVLVRARLTRADLRSADLSAADLRGAMLTHADLRGANLDGAKVDKKTTVDGERWGHTTCPDGRNSDDVGRSCDAHLTTGDQP
ncbi:MAG: pentapeptide repeat-containing protein [Actinomycetota bacterium]|nr:pentapeptide repeat-containing protein [Actinomycetota bacterium]